MANILRKIFGTTSEKEVKRLEPIVQKIEALEEEYRRLQILTADYEACTGERRRIE